MIAVATHVKLENISLRRYWDPEHVIFSIKPNSENVGILVGKAVLSITLSNIKVPMGAAMGTSNLYVLCTLVGNLMGDENTIQESPNSKFIKLNEGNLLEFSQQNTVPPTEDFTTCLDTRRY